MGDIRGYTLAQIEAFSDAIDKEDRNANRLAMIAARSANIDGNQFKKILKEIG